MLELSTVVLNSMLHALGSSYCTGSCFARMVLVDGRATECLGDAVLWWCCTRCESTQGHRERVRAKLFERVIRVVRALLSSQDPALAIAIAVQFALNESQLCTR